MTVAKHLVNNVHICSLKQQLRMGQKTKAEPINLPLSFLPTHTSPYRVVCVMVEPLVDNFNLSCTGKPAVLFRKK